jgi:hypothetical protein
MHPFSEYECFVTTTKSIYKLYRMSQEEISVFLKVIVSVILNKKVCTYMRRIPSGFRDRAISLYSILYTAQTSNTPCPHTSCKVH